jgi:hypothetical protein
LAIKEARFPSLSQVRPDLPPAFDAFIRRALARDPAHRFTSAQEMSEALDRTSTLPPSAGPVVSQPPQKPSSNAALFIGLGLAVFLFLGAGAVGIFFYVKGRSSAPTASRAAVTADNEPTRALAEPSSKPPPAKPSATEEPSATPSATNAAPALPRKVVDAGSVDAGVKDAGAIVDASVPEAGPPKQRQMFVGMALGQGVWDDAAVRSAANARLGAINACFAKLPPDETPIQEYSLRVDANGAVTSVSSVTGKAMGGGVDACMAGVLRGISLGKPKKEGNVLIGVAAKL